MKLAGGDTVINGHARRRLAVSDRRDRPYLVVPAGLLLFSAHPVELANNPAFIVKLVLIALPGADALAFHLLPYRSVAGWDRDRAAPPLARAGAALSILLWLGVITGGRMRAYL